MSFEVLNYWHPNLTINLVDDQTAWQRGAFWIHFSRWKKSYFNRNLHEILRDDSLIVASFLPDWFIIKLAPICFAGSLPSPLDEAVKFDPIDNTYKPIFFFNDYWNLAADYMLINSSVQELKLSVRYAPISLFKWQLYASQQVGLCIFALHYSKKFFALLLFCHSNNNFCLACMKR